MEENYELILNTDCLLEIIKYVISDYESEGRYFHYRPLKSNDLINFLLAHEYFVDLLKTHYNYQYRQIELALAVRMTKLIIDLRLNKLLNKRNDIFWRSYLHAIRETIDIPYVELILDNNCVFIRLSRSYGFGVGSYHEEMLILKEQMTVEALADICASIPKLRRLDLGKSQVCGSLTDMAPFCGNLKELIIMWNQEVFQYAPLAKLPNLERFFITGIQLSNSRAEFFNEMRKWKRPKSLPPLTLTIDDCSILGRTLMVATFESLQHFHIYNERKAIFFNAKYYLCETSEEISSIEERIITITVEENVIISFNTFSGKLKLFLPKESDTSKLVSLLKLPNLSRLVIERLGRTCTELKPKKLKSVSNLIRPLVPLAWKSFIVKNESLDRSESKDLATIKSIRYLSCNLSDWELMELMDQLTNLQFARVTVLSKCTTPAMGICNLLSTCLMGAEILSRDFNIIFFKNKQILKIQLNIATNADVLVPLAQLTHIKTLTISGLPQPGSLNALFQAFATGNLNKIEELDIQSNIINFNNIFKVTEIQTIKHLKISLIDPTGIEKLANLNNLEELSISTGEQGTLSGAFIELASRNTIQSLKILNKNLSPEDIIKVSQIRSLKKLECSVLNTEDLLSLTELASSAIENLTVFGLDSNNSLRKLFSAFSSSSTTRLQHLKIEGKALDKKEVTIISKMNNLGNLCAGFLHLKCLKLLNRLPHLENLVIDGFQQTRRNSLTFLPSTLRKLELNYSIGHSACRHLAKLDMLESLKCSFLDDPAIKLLANIKGLKKLVIYNASGSLCELFSAFAYESVSKLQELHTPIKSCNEILEISHIGSLISLSISFDTHCHNLTVLSQLKELKSLRVVDNHTKGAIDNKIWLPIFQSCQKLECVTIEIRNGVAKGFVREVYSILKSIRDPLTQTPLQLHLFEDTCFPSFYVDDIDDAYLKVFYTYNQQSFYPVSRNY